MEVFGLLGFLIGILVFVLFAVSQRRTNRRLKRLERQLGVAHHGLGDVSQGSARARTVPHHEGELDLTEVQNLVDAGNRIEAIKVYRELTGVGLAKAKEAVESL